MNFQAGGTGTAPRTRRRLNLIPVIDPTTDAGMVQEAAHAMMDTFEAAISFIEENRQAWPARTSRSAIEGIHWQIIAAARVGLNATRTAARRAKFMEECASWPDGVNGDVAQYVDAMGGTLSGSPLDFTEKWSWVKPEPDPFTRTDIMANARRFRGRHQR